MRYLGIDYGAKRIGVAISDEDGKMAFPHKVLSNDKKLLEAVQEICKEQKVRTIIMGESKDFDGRPNPIAKKIEEFKQTLEKLTRKRVEYEPEFLTSVQAARRQFRRPESSRGSGLRAERRRADDMLDASAAAIILQSYLDGKRNRELPSN